MTSADDETTRPMRRLFGLAGRRLMIVEDEPAVRLSLVRFFRELGSIVTPAAQLDEARALLERQRYDVVILDIGLTPYGTEGLELLRSGRTDAGRITIALTGCGETEAAALRLGASLALRKPLSPALLARKADELLRVADRSC
jgi:DNA-binding response OmpR family regulator